MSFDKRMHTLYSDALSLDPRDELDQGLESLMRDARCRPELGRLARSAHSGTPKRVATWSLHMPTETAIRVQALYCRFGLMDR